MSVLDYFMPITSYAEQFTQKSPENVNNDTEKDKTKKDNTNTVDIEAGGELKLNPNDKSIEYNSTLSISDKNVETVYKTTIDSDGNVKLVQSLNAKKYNFEVEMDSDYDSSGSGKKGSNSSKKTGKDVKFDKSEKGGKATVKNEKNKSDTKSGEGKTKKHELEGDSSCTIKYNLKLNDLAIVASYNSSFFKSKRSVDLKIVSDVELNVGIEGEYEGKVLISEVDVPIAGTAGLVSVRLKLYFLVDLSGEISLVCEIPDASIGVNISKNGITTPHSKSGSRTYMKASVTLAMGFSGEADVVVGDWLDLAECTIADPSIDVKFVGKAENLPQNEGYEDYEKCIQFYGYAPVIDFNVSSTGESVINTLIDIFDLPVKDTYEFITKEKAPLKLRKHMETELDGTINILDGGEEVCTHVKKIEETIEETV